MDQYQQYIHKSRYARYLDDEGRRETWDETVNRYVDFFVERGSIDHGQAFELFNAIRDMKVMPSMRCIMTAGTALKRDNVPDPLTSLCTSSCVVLA
jgi:ribonucleoside-diphosphate reductase alpha chain